ncbi:E3 ubiquitin-protein ligase hrd1 [Orbilia ellipsospora]|uniref:RING-type E3 ubiquitin transferase n=1 Tax=Orbilia ellipsospora TaxID=2528407 RepID=A0AAV9XEJ3_9PEZI
MRLAAYGTISTLMASGVVLHAFNQRANFYSACVHLAQSNFCLMVLTNFSFFMTLMFGKMVQKIFYGPLRPTEVEHLWEKAWYAITETCLAMTIFRDEFHSGFVAMFTVLLFVKCFHWLANDRVEYMEQAPPARPYVFHTRLASSLALLFTIDFLLCRYCVLTLMDLPKPNMLVMFAFEFAILLVNCSSTIGKYMIAITEKFITIRKTRQHRERRKRILQRRVDRGDITAEEMNDTILEEEEAGDIIGAWDGKSAWGFNLDIATDLLKLTIYLLFFAIVLMFYGLPLHIVRDVYLTVRGFISRVRDFIAYRKATTHMNTKYPDATREEIAREAVCIVCREEMVAWSDTPGANPQPAPTPADEEAEIIDERLRPKKLPCGHVLHMSCLKGWMERQQRCPTCRRPVLDDPTAAPGQQAGNNANQPWAAQQGAPRAADGAAPEANFVGGNQPPAPNAQQGPAPPAQAQGQPPVPGAPQNNQQPQQPAANPQGFRFNMFMPEGGFVNALARNLAERQQQGFQQMFDPRNPPAGNNQPGNNQPAAAAAEQPIPPLLNPLAPNLAGLGPTAPTATSVQSNLHELMNHQEMINYRILTHMRLIAEEVRQLRETMAANSRPSVPPVRESAAAPPTGGASPSASTSAATPGASTTSEIPIRNIPPAPSPNPTANTPRFVRTSVTPGSNVGSGLNTPGALGNNAQSAQGSPLPPGYQLPPGWSMIPLYPVAQAGQQPQQQQRSAFATPQHGPFQSTPPSSHQPFLNPLHPYPPPPSTSPSLQQQSPSSLPADNISLSSSGIRRRGVHRQYSNNLHSYHSMASPRREEQNPFAPSGSSQDSPSIPTIDSVSSGSTFNQQTANTVSSPSRQVTGTNNSHQSTTSSSPSRHGSISSTSREVLERRHREAHSPRIGSNLSPSGSVRSQQSTGNNNTHSVLQTPSTTADSSLSQVFTPMSSGASSTGGSGRRSDIPTLDTSAEHNHPVDSTHDPSQGRSPIEERRRASAGEILLSETDTSWPAPAPIIGSGSPSEASVSPPSSLPSSRVGSVRRNRRSSGAGIGASLPGGNGSPIGTTGMFNVIPKSQASSTAGSPVMRHSHGLHDIGSPSRISLDKGKEKETGSIAGGSSEEFDRGRTRLVEEQEEDEPKRTV